VSTPTLALPPGRRRWYPRDSRGLVGGCCPPVRRALSAPPPAPFSQRSLSDIHTSRYARPHPSSFPAVPFLDSSPLIRPARRP
jgi:hypothetical protein